ncbi:MFS transporter (plasmid) [Polymorphobacter sp. PAMC 29334]|uniref:MFS transporter n=1 Tax=Polymorphobacter sp. PAMC 29334 TaxID=2862331 RepID=UPI001C663D26|nr:MFS transporter [Polymorphobacter sp. PAMC 29334]QYE37118.1 MFS transporter [Polymorphobacter sp. PAMC 29334]
MQRWIVLLGCFIGMSVATPAILLVPMGLFLKPVTSEFGWSRTEFSYLISIAAMFNAIAMPLAGYLVDRFGPRRIIAVGTLLGCGSYAALSLASSYVGFAVTIAVTVMLSGLASYPAFLGLTQRWFDRRLGFALAITSTGLAAGVGVFSWIIARTNAMHGWRASFLTVAMTALAVGVVNILFFVRDNRGPLPAVERRDGMAQSLQSGETLGAALRTRDFWLYATSFCLVIFAVVGCNSHLPALLSDRGASTDLLASVVAIGSAGSLVGRLFTGMLLDRFSVRSVAGVFLLGQAVGFLLLLEGLRWVLPAGFLLGAVQGAEIDVLGFVIARRFGRIAYARIFGSCFALTLLGAVVGPVAMALVFDRTGSYDGGLTMLPLFPAIAFGLLCIARFAPPTETATVLPLRT